MGRKKNPNSVSNYFNSDVEEAIQLYNKAETQSERDRLFRVIYPAISKIAEVMYNKVKPTYMDGEPLDIMMDCTAYLSERMDMIKAGKGKAFSYFTVCARNYYIFHNMRAYTGVKKVLNYNSLPDDYDAPDIDDNRLEEMEDTAKLLSAFADYLERNDELLSSESSRKSRPVIKAVIDLIRNIDSIDDFNRRNIMNNLTEIDGLKVDRHYITKVFTKITIHYNMFRKDWNKGIVLDAFVRDRLTDEEIQYCIENYTPIDRKHGVVALSKLFGVDEYEIRKHLHKAGLASI
jgi:hypothetical protein